MVSNICYNYTVTVIVSTYNHVNYIEKNLNGILSQKTDFPFLVIVYDDCSTDGTSEIVRQYESRYPKQIKGYYMKENMFSKGESPYSLLSSHISGAKYLAICEGDDYWIDPLKLQKQVDYLEKQTNCTLCFHNAFIVREGIDEDPQVNFPMESREYQAHEFFHKWVITTASIMFRTSILQSPKAKKCMYDKRFIQIDVVLWLLCASQGKVYGLKDVMSVHRLLKSGYTTQFNSNSDRLCELNYKYCEHNKALMSMFGQELGGEFVACIRSYFFRYNRKGQALAILNLNVKYWWLFVLQSLKESTFQTFLSIFFTPFYVTVLKLKGWVKKIK